MKRIVFTLCLLAFCFSFTFYRTSHAADDPSVVVTSDTDYYISTSQNNTIFVSAGEVTFHLPPSPRPEMFTCYFIQRESHRLTVVVNDTENLSQQIVGFVGSSGFSSPTINTDNNDVISPALTLKALDANEWGIFSVTGNWVAP